MAKADMMSILYSKEKSPLEFHFDQLVVPSMYNYVSVDDIQKLNNIASSVRYAGNIEKKYNAIKDVMENRGFKKFHCGTNRIVYKYLEDTRFLFKIGLDKVGLLDNPNEYKNQFLLKPFVTKTFEVSPCGTVGVAERVQPITSRQEFMSVASDIFTLLNDFIIGNYVVDDIGSKFFLNWGIRNNFGLVLLDYTYVYKLDGKKLYCNKVHPITNQKCNGVIDYDAGFNNLYCTKCGKKYFAYQLKESIDNNLIILKDKGESEMKVRLMRGTEVVKTFDSTGETQTMKKDNRSRYSEEQERKASNLNPKIVGGNHNQCYINTEDIYKQAMLDQQYQPKAETLNIDLNNPEIQINEEEKKELKFEVKSTFIPSPTEEKKEEIVEESNKIKEEEQNNEEEQKKCF